MGENHNAEIAALFEQNADYLYNYAITRVNDQQTAEDLVQDTFISALKNYGSFKARSKASTWLIAILKNKIIDLYRKKVREFHKESLDELSNLDDFFNEKGHWKSESLPQDWKVDSAKQLEQKEFYETLQKCLARLSEIQRMAFVMKNMDDVASEEICKELEITASNYWVIIHRAKLQLRVCLEKHWIKA